MNHLDDLTLDRLLDGDLAPAERAAAEDHLAGCALCRDELAATRGLYAALDALPPEPLPFDLTPRVLARVGPQAARRRRWIVGGVLAAQLALTIALALWLVPALLGARPWSGEAPGFARLPWPAIDPALLAPARLVGPLAAWSPLAGLAPTASPTLWAIVAAAALTLWLVGNRVALPSGGRERGA